jgi:hypothetical protein
MFKENSITFLWEQNKLPKTQYLKKKKQKFILCSEGQKSKEAQSESVSRALV